MINVRYVGALKDSSGYAAAARDYILALMDQKEINLTATTVSFEQQKTTHGLAQQKIEPLINKPLDSKIQIIHLTPENYPMFKNDQLYNIAYTTWETDRLPKNWVPLINSMDEIWVPSQWNVEVFKKSGIIKPIYKIPHVITMPILSNIEKVEIGNPNTFVFASVFQYIERKNPSALLKAYLTEFQNGEDVALALKTYRLGTSAKEQDFVKGDISHTKEMLRLEHYPPILFFGNLMTREYMKGFYQRGDCFVFSTRAEGFGIPQAEAMSFGKPIISTNYGGTLEFMNEKNSYLVDYQETPVSGMIFPNYIGTMNWAEPSVCHFKKLMRQVYENQKEAKEKGKVAEQFIKDNLNSKVIGDLMVNRLKAIAKRIGL